MTPSTQKENLLTISIVSSSLSGQSRGIVIFVEFESSKRVEPVEPISIIGVIHKPRGQLRGREEAK